MIILAVPSFCWFFFDRNGQCGTMTITISHSPHSLIICLFNVKSIHKSLRGRLLSFAVERGQEQLTVDLRVFDSSIIDHVLAILSSL